MAAQMPVRIDDDVYRNARVVAAFKGIGVSEYISSIMRPIAARDLKAMAEQIQAKGQGGLFEEEAVEEKPMSEAATRAADDSKPRRGRKRKE